MSEYVRNGQLRPVAARRVLCYELVRLIGRAEVSPPAMAAHLHLSTAALHAMLHGERLPTVAVLKGITDRVEDAAALPRLVKLLDVAQESRALSLAPGNRELLHGLEACARRIDVYDPLMISPLLNGSRATVLTARPLPRVVWVTDEHMLMRRSRLASAQVERLCALADRINVTVHVLPATADKHYVLRGGFEIVSGPAGVVACEETLYVNLYHHQPKAVAEFERRFRHLRGSALGQEDSRKLLANL
ncbi:Scr1 family TA system antitoxin-like transcriptional regulator [Actinokineospora sp. NPDC004072]